MNEVLRYIALYIDRRLQMHRRQHIRHAPPAFQAEYARSRSRHGRGGPRARRGDVRAAILALLLDRPMHGYEMIQELEERTGGAWSPSAGSIYPTLQLLEDEGLIAGTETEGKRRFELTDAGRTEADKREGATPWEAVTSGVGPEVVNLKRSLQQLTHAAAQAFRAGDPAQQKRVSELLDDARRSIYGVLAEQD
jgi:DNA-binding PadR family transcriptional regulator